MRYILSIILLFYYVSIAESKDLLNFQHEHIKSSLFFDITNIKVTLPVSKKSLSRPLHKCWKTGGIHPFFFLRAKNAHTLEELYAISQSVQNQITLNMSGSLYSNPKPLNVSYYINQNYGSPYWGNKIFTYNVSSEGYTQRWYEMNELLDYDEKNLYFTLENNVHNINFSNLQIYSHITEEKEGFSLFDYRPMPIFDINNTSTKYKIHDFVPETFKDIDFTGDLPKKIYIDNNNFKKTTTYFIPNDITLHNYDNHIRYFLPGYKYSHVLTLPTPRKSLPDMTTAHIIECF